MWDLLGQIGYQVSRAANAVQETVGLKERDYDPNDFDGYGVRKPEATVPFVPGYNPANGGSLDYSPTPEQARGMVSDPVQQQKIGDTYRLGPDYRDEMLRQADPASGNFIGTGVGQVGAGAGSAATAGNAATSTGTGAAGAGLGIGVPEIVQGVGGVVGAIGAKSAADQQAEAAREAARLQSEAAAEARKLAKEQFDQVRADQAPWREAGGRALTSLESFDANNPDFGMSQFQADPGYSFRLKEGMKALENSAAARGGLLSGNALKGITNYGQEAASQEYNNAFNRYNTQRGMRLNRLQSLAGVGQTAVQQTGQAGQNYANNAGNALVGGANALAQDRIGQGNANASGIMGMTNSFSNMIGNYYNNKMSQDYVNALRGGQ